MKPIEPGCLALLRPVVLVTERFVGCDVVDVIRQYHGRVDFKCGHVLPWVVSAPSAGLIIVCSCDLTRIDGYDPDTEITEKDKELTI